ncbi:MAG: hypothetical protein ACOC37_02225 [Spirochaetota bacterium]
MGNFIANQIADEYASFVRERYLSGQKLSVRTGLTRRSTRFFKQRNGVFGVRPGSGVRGRLNYLVRYERGKRAFMRPSWRAFRSRKRHQQIANEVIAGVLRRMRV